MSFRQKLDDAATIDKRLMAFETALKLKKSCLNTEITAVKADCISLKAAGITLTKVSNALRNNIECSKDVIA